MGWRLVFGVTAVGIAAGGRCAGFRAQGLNQFGVAGSGASGKVLAAVDLRIQRVADVALLPANAAIAAGFSAGGGRGGRVGLPSGMIAASNGGGLRASGSSQVIQLVDDLGSESAIAGEVGRK